MRHAIALCVVLAGAGCKGKGKHPFAQQTNEAEPATAGPGSASAPTPSAAPSAPPAAAPPVTPAATPQPGPGDQPPLSADVLPRGEATPNTRVVITDDFRFQVPQDFKRIELDGRPAYTGTLEGMVAPATVTFSATSEPFKGSLDDLVTREINAATAAGAAAPTAGPVMILVGEEVKQQYARRMTVKLPDRFEQRTMVVHGGKAYVHRCATPKVANAWANVGADCVTRSTTFVVAPPPLAPKAATPPPPPAPATPNVVFMASKVQGTGRSKKDVNPWLEDFVAPFVKPCLAGLPSQTAPKVEFQIGKDGKAGKSTVMGSDSAGVPVKVDDAVSACVAKVIDAAKIDGAGSDVVNVGMIFSIK